MTTDHHLGPYERREQIGAGGMGVVYRARREGADHDVALKVIAAGEDASAEALARFQREARIATELDHPGIVKVLETGEDAATGHAWFAMELVEGDPLSKQIKEREFTWQEAVTIVRDVADALSVAHAKGVLHRDVKPSNILMDASGKPHLSDFGLAKDTRTESKYTRTGETLGTPAYMSPEQARGDLAQLTPASDVWALGCVLYELMMNRLAFEGDTPAAVIGAVMTATPDLRTLPAPVRQVASVCLQRDARRRYADAGALRDDCVRVLAGQAPLVKPPSKAVPFTLAAAAVLALAGGAAWLAWSGEQEAASASTAVEAAAPSRAERLAERAWGMRHQLPEEAIAGLERALELEPQRDAWRVQLGLLRWARNDGDGAAAEWDRVDESTEHGTAARFYKALSLFFQRRKFDLGGGASVEHLKWVMERDGRFAALARAALLCGTDDSSALDALEGRDSWEASLLRSQALLRVKPEDLPRTQRELERVLDLGLHFSWAWSNLGTARQRQHDREGAMQAFTRAIELDSDNQWAYQSRAHLRLRAGDLDGAEADLTEVLRILPDYEKARSDRLTLRFNRKQWAKALEDMDQVRVTREVVGSLSKKRAIALYELERYRESLGAAQLSTKADPGDPEAWLVLAKSLWALEDARTAAAAFQESLRRAPKDADANFQFGRLLMGLGEPAAAIPHFTATIETDPNHAGAWADRAVAHRRTHRRDKAVADATRAIELDDRLARAYVVRGLERLRTKQWRSAVADLGRAGDLEPGRPDVLSALGLCLLKTGEYAEAVRIFELFLKGWAGRSPMEKDVREWLAEAKAKAGK